MHAGVPSVAEGRWYIPQVVSECGTARQLAFREVLFLDTATESESESESIGDSSQ